MSDHLFSVAGNVVLLTGASRGIGRAIAEGFAKRGARVIITGRVGETLEKTAQEIAGPEPVRPIVCDIADVQAVRDCVAAVLADYGHIDTLVNVAGVNKRMPAQDYSPEDYDFIVDINMKGAFFMSTEVGRAMIERGRGNQINIDSLNTHAPLTNVTPYAMSKGAMNMMTRGLAAEWGKHGIRVNGIAPGFIVTDLSRKLWQQSHMSDWAKTNTPAGRLGAVEDLVGTAIYLASRAAAFVTGQTIRVDGGMSAGIAWPIEG